jgi:hypothetical protein
LFACFMAVLVTWMSFAFGARESRRGALIMLETHIVMSSLISHLVLILMIRRVLTLVLRLAHLLTLCLIFLMDLTIAHMVLFHERTTLCLDALVMTHVLIVVIVSHATLSPNTWMVHVFPVVVLIPLVQRVRCKRQ